MTTLINLSLLLLCVAVTVPTLVVVTECLVAVFGRNRVPHLLSPQGLNPRVAVLIPAHNEEAMIADTLGCVLPQLKKGDRLVVVADNCTDQTAGIAAHTGAEVLVRNHVKQLGKGYALAFGVAALAADPPDVVIVLDADTKAQTGALTALAAQAAETGLPAQAVYLMELPSKPQSRDVVSALAFLVKNQVRPLGTARLGLPCHLTGAGMAFPWSVIKDAPLAGGNIVEDMQLGIDLAIAGRGAILCPQANLTGILPSGSPASRNQRQRWEHGHLRTLLTQVPRLLVQAIRQCRIDLLGFALDLSVPPLSLLVLLLVALTTIVGIWGIVSGHWLALVIPAMGLGALTLAIVTAWSRFGRALVSFQQLLAIPAYVFWKIPLYVRFIFRPERAWIRTPRDLTLASKS